MMTSLRSRLLLSYGLLIAVLLCLFSAGSLTSLLRNPLVYENAAQQLRTAQRDIQTYPGLLEAVSAAPASAVERAARQLGVRVVLVNNRGAAIADSQASVPLRTPPARLRLLAQRNEITFLRDDSNRLWLALVEPAAPQTYLVLALSRPRLVIFEFFNNDLLRPAMLSGLVGLALAVLIAVGMAQWISAPLKRIGQAADAVAAGQYQMIPLDGPAEVRSLANSFNRMAQRVQDALQSQRDLVANVSHELKTPLTSIQGFARAILDGVSQSPEEIRRAAEVIDAESSRMSRLVQDLVTLARLEAKAPDFQPAPVDIGALAQSVADRFRPQAGQAGVQLDLQVPGQAARVVGDGDQLAQMMVNLVDNAIKYTPSGGVINLGVRSTGNHVEIRVADTGPGIPPVDRERVFQRFYRADRTKPGTGLGLAITRQIVLAHGGTIRYEENQPHGSVFIVDLPVPPGARAG